MSASLKRRKAPSGGGGSSGTGGQSLEGRQSNPNGMLRFYTDDAPGLKIGPTTVLILSLAFIAFVVLLHIWGKLTQSSSSVR